MDAYGTFNETHKGIVAKGPETRVSRGVGYPLRYLGHVVGYGTIGPKALPQRDP